MIAIPGVGSIAAGIQKWSAIESSTKKFAAHLASNTNDLWGTLSRENIDADSTSLNAAGSSNSVIRKALTQAYKQVGLAIALHGIAAPAVITKNLTDMQVKNAWSSAGLPILNNLEFAKNISSTDQLDLTARIYLYNMLREYTQRWVTYKIRSSPDVGTAQIRIDYNKTKSLPEDGNRFGEFTGMSQTTRDAIYERFGNYTGAIFQGKTMLPPISGYRDMVEKWNLKVVL